MLLTLWLAIIGVGDSATPIVVQDVQVTLLSQVKVPSRDAGVLIELNVREGDLVTENAVLGRLERDLAILDEQLANKEHEIARVKSENDIDRRFAKKSQQVAESELTRAEESVKQYPKSISQTELSRLRLLAEKAVLAIEQSEKDLQMATLTTELKQVSVQTAKTHLQRREITAPLTGMVVQIFSQPGTWLNPGDPVVRVLRLNRLRIEGFIDGHKYGNELLGRDVVLDAPLPPGNQIKSFHGKLTFISPELDPVTSQIRVWAEVENPDLELRPGTRGRLTIQPANR